MTDHPIKLPKAKANEYKKFMRYMRYLQLASWDLNETDLEYYPLYRKYKVWVDSLDQSLLEKFWDKLEEEDNKWK